MHVLITITHLLINWHGTIIIFTTTTSVCYNLIQLVCFYCTCELQTQFRRKRVLTDNLGFPRSTYLCHLSRCLGHEQCQQERSQPLYPLTSGQLHCWRTRRNSAVKKWKGRHINTATTWSRATRSNQRLDVRIGDAFCLQIFCTD